MTYIIKDKTTNNSDDYWLTLSKKRSDEDKILYKWHPVSNLYKKETLLYKILKFFKLKKG